VSPLPRPARSSIPVEVAPVTPFPASGSIPRIASDAYVHPSAKIIGSVVLESGVFVAPMACIRADCGGPIQLSEGSSVGDQVSITGFNTHDERGGIIEKNVVFVRNEPFSVFVGRNSHVFAQSGIHGPVILGDNVFVMSQSFLMMAIVESDVIVEPDAKVIGVRVSSGRIVPAGAVVKTQEVANGLPRIMDDYPLLSVSSQVGALRETMRKAYLRRDA
jgi:carbonic anhydrase/acetyltransferase-like protein (isoleucine patch superfamily)